MDKLIDRRRNWESRTEMSILERPQSELGTYDKLLYVALCGFASHSGTAFPSIKLLAQVVSCSICKISQSLKVLESVGLIVRHHQYRNDGGQTSSLIEIHGFEKYTPLYDIHTPPTPRIYHITAPIITEKISSLPSVEMAAPAADAPPTAARRPAVASLFFSEIKEKTERLPFVEDKPKPASPEPEEEIYDIAEAPDSMRQAATYLLLRTGRIKLSGDELDALSKLDAEHYPAFVQKKIDEIVERFTKKGKELKTLTFCYIAAALKNFSPTLRARASPKRPPRADIDDFALADFERRAENYDADIG